MVYITGDTHADFKRFNTKLFPEQKEMTYHDIVIVLGDFGLWHDSPEERYWFNWLAEKPFTLCFCDGNHENFDRLYSSEFEVVDFHGGKAHKIRDNIFHLMRGYIFDFEGKKFFCMGGAKSHDIQDGILDPDDYPDAKTCKRVFNKWNKERKMFRVNHLSWWKEELPSQEEMDSGEQNLANYDYEVDYVISHCLPQGIASAAGYYEGDSLTLYFDKLLQHGLKFKRWFCGHYHANRTIMGKFIIKYHDIERIL